MILPQRMNVDDGDCWCIELHRYTVYTILGRLEKRLIIILSKVACLHTDIFNLHHHQRRIQFLIVDGGDR